MRALREPSPGQPPLSVATFAGALLGAITFASASVAVILPDIIEGFALRADSAAWVISLYMLGVSVFTALYGRLADLYGIRTPLAVGTSVLAIGSLLAAVAPGFGVLLVARAIQGIGAASMPALLPAAVERLFDGRLRSRALAAVSGIAIAVASAGPLAGGLVAEAVGWRVSLALPLVGLVAMVPVWRWLPRTGTGEPVDYAGAVLVVLAATGVVLLLQSPAATWPAAQVGAGLVLLAAPLLRWHVRRRPDGFLPRAVLAETAMLRITVGGAVVPAAFFAQMMVLPLTLDSLGWRPWQVGLAMAPGALAGLLSSRLGPPLLDRLGGARCVVGAALTTGLLMVGCATAVGLADAWISPAILVLTSFGATGTAALTQAALMAEVGSRFPLRVRGAAMGVATLVFMVGAAFGAAALGGLTGAFGMAPAVLVVAGACACGAVLARVRSPRA